MILKGATLSHQLTWSHYVEILKIDNLDKLKYYIYIVNKFSLSVRELREKIKSNEYERIENKIELETPKVNTLIKNPILIKVKNKNNKLTEYVLQQSILENMEDFLRELGIGFTFVGSEVKIKIGDRYYRIDFLLFNTEYNCYVVIELKITEMRPEYIGQVLKYINYVDKHIKKIFHEQTVGVIICKKNNEFIMEYCTNPNIFTTTYLLEGSKV